MKKLLLMCGALLAGVYLYAQNTTWILAPNYYDVTTNSLIPLPHGPNSGFDYSGEVATTAQNAWVDTDGKLLFFIVDDKIFDREGYLIQDQMKHQNYDLKGTCEIAIVPDPGNCQRYYIFTAGKKNYSVSPGDKIPFYCILDLSLTNMFYPDRFGDLVVFPSAYKFENIADMVTNFNYNDPKGGGVFFAVSELRSDLSRFVFVSSNFGIYRFKLDEYGFFYDNSFLSFPSAEVDPLLRGEMELVNLPSGGYRIAAPFYFHQFPSGGGHGGSSILRYAIYTARLDNNGDVIPPEIYIPYHFPTTGNRPYIHGLEFSPDGNILYIAHNVSSTHTNAIDFVDYSNITAGAQPLSIPSAGDFESSQIEMGIDGDLYFATGNRLAKLTDPNNPNASNWVDNVTTMTYAPNYEGSPSPSHLLKSYVLPDQIDGGSYTNHIEETLECCKFYSNYEIDNYTIVNSGTWNGVSNPISPGSSIIYIRKELRVPAGKNLNIRNMTLKFAPGARLVIESGTGTAQGGKLYLMNDVLLTVDERCSSNEMWLGVEVWGNSTNVQGTVVNSTQGVLRMYSNSRVEHAVIGVLASKRNESSGVPIPHSSYDNNRNGGVVVVSGSTFFNCHRGIVFQTYNVGTNNLSSVNSSDFIWDGLLKNTSLKPQAHITLSNCTDIGIGASNFYQLTPHLYSDPVDRGGGIAVINSSFRVLSSCNVLMPIGHDCPDANNVPSKFENLYIGIMVLNLNVNSKPFTVLRNEFTNCLSGVSSIGAKNQDISRNKFYIPESNTIQTWGIYVASGTGYRIAENYLRGYDNTSIALQDARTYGIIIDNSGEQHNEVYKNTFEELYVGTQAQGNNAKVFVPGSNDNGGGLRYHCNEFKHPIHLADIGVNGRIDYEHGRIGGLGINEARNENTARNKFSMSGENQLLYPDHDIMLHPSSQQLVYVHLSDISHTPDNYTNSPPTAVYPYVQNWGGTLLSSDGATCPTKFPPVVRGTFFIKEINLLDSLQSMIDAGKTNRLLDLIANQSNESTTFNELINASPYLSDGVLESYIHSASSNEHLKNVLIANSQLSDHIWNVLRESNRSEQLQRDLQLYQNKVSAQKELINKIKTANEKLNGKQRDFISAIMADTSITATSDSLVKYLELCRGIDFKQSLLAQYSNRQEQVKFDQLLNELSKELSSELIELYKVNYRRDNFISMDESVKQNMSLVPDIKHIINSKTDNYIIKAIEAMNILHERSTAFDVLPLSSAKQNDIKTITREEPSGNRKKERTADIKLSPNPSDGIVHIRFSELESDLVTVELVDLTGKHVFNDQFSKTTHEKIDLSHLKKGVYIVNVIVNGIHTQPQLLVLE